MMTMLWVYAALEPVMWGLIGLGLLLGAGIAYGTWQAYWNNRRR